MDEQHAELGRHLPIPRPGFPQRIRVTNRADTSRLGVAVSSGWLGWGGVVSFLSAAFIGLLAALTMHTADQFRHWPVQLAQALLAIALYALAVLVAVAPYFA